jgi:hypothetical protein
MGTRRIRSVLCVCPTAWQILRTQPRAHSAQSNDNAARERSGALDPVSPDGQEISILAVARPLASSCTGSPAGSELSRRVASRRSGRSGCQTPARVCPATVVDLYLRCSTTFPARSGLRAPTSHRAGEQLQSGQGNRALDASPVRRALRACIRGPSIERSGGPTLPSSPVLKNQPGTKTTVPRAASDPPRVTCAIRQVRQTRSLAPVGPCRAEDVRWTRSRARGHRTSRC